MFLITQGMVILTERGRLLGFVVAVVLVTRDNGLSSSITINEHMLLIPLHDNILVINSSLDIDDISAAMVLGVSVKRSKSVV